MWNRFTKLSLQRPIRASFVAATVTTGTVLFLSTKPAVVHADSKEKEGKDLSEQELKMVLMVHRHGARSPIGDAFKDLPSKEHFALWGKCRAPFEPLHHSDCDAGALTALGEKQMTELGEALREIAKQAGFVGDVYHPEELFVTSTKRGRTILSVKTILRTLYPGVEPPNGDWASIITFTPPKDEWLTPNEHKCLRLRELTSKAKQSALYQRYVREEDDEPHDLGDGEKLALSARLGVKNPDDPRSGPGGEGLVNVNDNNAVAALAASLKGRDEYIPNYLEIYDTIHSAEAHGIHLPRSKVVTPAHDAYAAQAAFDMVETVLVGRKSEMSASEQQELVRLGIGPLVHRLFETINDRAKGESALKVGLYSAHDITILPLLGALGVYPKSWPPFASNVRFELWGGPDSQSSSSPLRNPTVKVYFANKMVLGGQLAEVENKLKHMMLSEAEYREECKPHSQNPPPPHQWSRPRQS